MRAVASATPRFAAPHPLQADARMETVRRAVDYAAHVEAAAGPWAQFGPLVGTLAL